MHDLQLWGAGAFGAIIGWYIYYINRQRREEVTATDLVTLIGIVGGSAILKLFPEQTNLFGAYGIGLAAGFFGYFLIMVLLVVVSKNFDADYFLDGRRKKPAEPYYIPTRDQQAGNIPAPMAAPPRRDGDASAGAHVPPGA
jgi:hypothetical protein